MAKKKSVSVDCFSLQETQGVCLMRDWILFIALLLLILTTANALPTTTFSSFQVPNTTDQNITLTCTDNNTECKTINYNINSTEWNQYNVKRIDTNTNIDYNVGLSLSGCYNTSYGIRRTDTFSKVIDQNKLLKNLQLNVEMEAERIGYWYLKIFFADGTTENTEEKNYSGGRTPTNLIFSNFTKTKDFNKIEIWAKSNYASPCADVYTNSLAYRYDTNTLNSYPSYSFLFSGAGDHNIQYFSTDNSDNNETIKFSYFPQFQTTQDQTNSRMILTGVTIYNDYNVTSWLWSVDGTPITGTTDRIKYYSTQANLDLNVCLTTNSLDTTCRSVNTWDTISPTIDANIVTAAFGFTTNFDINYNMICYDNFTPIDYLITWNNGTTNTTLYNSSDANATLKTGTLDLNSSQNATITFTCTDDSNNTATYTSERFYAVLFSLINEATGAKLTWADLNTNLNIARVYTPDGNYSFDFNSSVKSDVNFFSPSSLLYFEFGYKDTGLTKISRQIDFGLIDDSNIGVCVPFYQTFYQQRFVANSPRQMVLQNNVSRCYVVAGTLDYVYDTGYSITTYTIPKPYYLYIWVSGVKTFLALIDGAVATQYNLDAIAFSRTAFNIVVGQDTVGFAPLINTVTNAYDTNTLQIYYKSFAEDNSQVEFTIKNGDSTIWNYAEFSSPDELLINFYWGGLGINDQNVLELVVQTTDTGGSTTTKSYYFTVYGNYYPNEGANGWVVIIAGLFFLFGITLVAAGRAFGIFGVIICVICLAITGIASGAWWISLMQAIFLICLMYIIMMGKTTMGQLG